MTTTLAPELSAALADRYVLERELGGGGMSRVFLARAEILAVLGQRAEAGGLLEPRMYRIFVNSFADWGLVGERLRGEPTFEEYVRRRG